MNSNNKIYSLGIVGVRGYVGKELLGLLLAHPQINIDWISSRQLKGQLMSSLLDKGFDNSTDGHTDTRNDCTITSLSAKEVALRGTDIVVLALPNGLAEPFVEEITLSNTTKVIIDLSADYRFGDRLDVRLDKDWIYCLPELDHKALEAAHNLGLIKISNPGCYATAMQLVIAPIQDLLSRPANCFGVSGFSGAGTTPSAFNDPDNLKDNLIGYKLVDHLHEKEVTTRLNSAISFSPHVAEFFRGINMTVQLEFKQPQSVEGLLQSYNQFYQHFPLVECQLETPTIQQVINKPISVIGGITVSSDGKRATIINCLDNLLKGAASQALQNINIALGLDPLLAIQSNDHLSTKGEG
ncbi:MAG: N-acetyl-gamma-glutamyl-phosphate reductase [Gammaproteobacteria bacterium]|nr:MAG: N-acetyl-gamma-glutamyl-phosphate reductase [Gammaproteobacteria bacterium]